MRIVLKNARISFIDSLWTAKSVKGVPDSAVRYNCRLDIPKDHPQAKELLDAQTQVGKEKWGAKADKVLKTLLADPNKCAVRDGDFSPQEGYDGRWYLSANAGTNGPAPQVRAANGKDRIAQSDGILYAGCYVNAYIDIYATDKGGNKICCGLVAIQFRKNGDPMSSSAPVRDDEFEDLSLEEEEEF